MNYDHLTGPDFLAAIAETELNIGNDANALEFRRRSRAWTLDQDARDRAQQRVAELQELLRVRSAGYYRNHLTLPPERVNGGRLTAEPLPEIDHRHYPAGAIVLAATETGRSRLLRKLRSWIQPGA